MIDTARLGGFFAAHAIWSVSDGETLIPMLAIEDANGEQAMTRFEGEELGACVAEAQSRLESNESGSVRAAVLYDARIMLAHGKQDAIVVEMRVYAHPEAFATMAVPYTPKDPDGFKVHRPKLLAWDGCDAFDMQEALESFFVGVEAHEHGSKVWGECLDESI